MARRRSCLRSSSLPPRDVNFEGVDHIEGGSDWSKQWLILKHTIQFCSSTWSSSSPLRCLTFVFFFRLIHSTATLNKTLFVSIRSSESFHGSCIFERNWLKFNNACNDVGEFYHMHHAAGGSMFSSISKEVFCKIFLRNLRKLWNSHRLNPKTKHANDLSFTFTNGIRISISSCNCTFLSQASAKHCLFAKFNYTKPNKF